MSANISLHTPQGTDVRMVTAMQKIERLLVPNERMLASARQGRVPAYLRGTRRGVLVATTNRIVCIRRGLIAGFKMHDMQWQDVVDARIEEGILGSTVMIRSKNIASFSIDGLEKRDAQNVYVICQQQEQVWREKNRVRSMEESRGGYATNVPAYGAPLALAQSSGSHDPTQKLAQAKGMLDQGLISADEYESIKAKVFANF